MPTRQSCCVVQLDVVDTQPVPGVVVVLAGTSSSVSSTIVEWRRCPSAYVFALARDLTSAGGDWLRRPDRTPGRGGWRGTAHLGPAWQASTRFVAPPPCHPLLPVPPQVTQTRAAQMPGFGRCRRSQARPPCPSGAALVQSCPRQGSPRRIRGGRWWTISRAAVVLADSFGGLVEATTTDENQALDGERHGCRPRETDALGKV